MGKGKRIQDFRNLNLNSSIKEQEFIIEVEEKPREAKNNDAKIENKAKSNKVEKKQKEKKEKKPQKEEIKKTYIEKEIERKKKEQRKQTSILISTFLLIFITIGIIAGCLITPTFDVVEIQVEDGVNVVASELQKYFTEVKGKNTFLIDTFAIEEEIEKHPYIYQATVTRKLPDELSVEYNERKPYAFLKYIESYVLMDKYGNILEVKKENNSPDLPIIYGIESDEYIAGKKLEGMAKLKFENIIYLLETASHIGFEYNISEVNYTDTEEMCLSITNMNVEIIYGTVEKSILNDKMTYLNEVLKKLENKKGTLDISSSNYSEKVIFKEILK